MRYSTLSKRDREKMLASIGVEDVEALFASIPKEHRIQEPLQIEGPIPEMELLRRMDEAAPPLPRVSLVGAGLYQHYIPPTAHSLAGRSEWVTSYTPYQPEISQGTLLMYYEFQSWVSLLTGQEVANAGMYDGSTALAEAVLMARRIRKNAQILYVSEAVHPSYRAVLATYTQFQDIRLELLPVDPETGRTRVQISGAAQKDALAVVLQSPNFFGVIEDAEGLEEEAFLIHVVAEAQSLALLQPLPADVTVGEMQSLGIPIQLGGPSAGFLATSKDHVRQLPGRLVGRTRDRSGKEAWCITLATREQFIRREKATSNICTSSGLMCLRSVIYLALMGKRGLQEAARMSAKAARAFALGMESLSLGRSYSGSFFNEFVLDLASRPGLFESLRRRGFLLGVPLKRWFPKEPDRYLVALTECSYPRVPELIEEVANHVHAS